MVIIPARCGRAVRLSRGSAIEIVNTRGTQVVDAWALRLPGLVEHLSMEHTRAMLGRLIPRVGDALYSSERRVLLTLVADTSPGTHDTLIASCDPERYRLLGHRGYHDNCRDNFAAALRELGVPESPAPAPLNLFMNVPWAADGSLRFEPPRSKPGDLVRMRAETDLIVVMSACPQDLLPVNGAAMVPAEAGFRVLAADDPEAAG